MIPPLVVTIGATALDATRRIERPGISLRENVGTATLWFGRELMPLYHPSPQVLISRRNLAQQEEDWRRLGSWLAPRR